MPSLNDTGTRCDCAYSEDGTVLLECTVPGELCIVQDGCNEIADGAFAGVGGLKQVELPESLTVIGKSAFQECIDLAEVNLPEGLRSIDDQAFMRTSLAQVRIPASLEHLGKLAFFSVNVVLDSSLAFLSPSNNCGFMAIEPIMRDSGRLSKLARETASAKVHDLDLELDDDSDSNPEEPKWESLLKSDETDSGEECIPAISVAAGNERFRIVGDFLCEVREDGSVEALQYAGGSETHITIPHEVTLIGPYALRSASNVTDLHLHDGIRWVEDFGLTVSQTLESILIDEADGHTAVVYPYKSLNQPASVFIDDIRHNWSYMTGRPDFDHMVNTCDNSLIGMSRSYERTRLIIARLANGRMLSKIVKPVFTQAVQAEFEDTVAHMASIDDFEGVKMMLEAGLIDDGNIAHAAAIASEAGGVAVAHLLLEEQRARGGRSLGLDL